MMNFSLKGSDEVVTEINAIPYTEPTTTSDAKGCPNYGIEGLWIVTWLSILEYGILWLKSKPLPPIHENLMSLAHAIFNQLVKLCVRSVEFSAYIWLWERYSPFQQLFDDSLASFLSAIVLIDFGYYWFHRFSHEVMLFWAIHQVHHSSFDLTVSVGLRHSPLQNLFSWIFYLPLALVGLPPSHLAVHIQLNLLYQTWIHTQAIETLGLLEWIFNTPSHHRVHHGSIKYCIDTNYGGIFIFWDRLFGTFEKERQDEEIVYGILLQPEFWNIFSHQIVYLDFMIQKAKSMSTWADSLNVIWKGPSWQPGSSRTGRELDASYVSGSRVRIQANASLLIDSYVCLHLMAALLLLSRLMETVGTGLPFFAAYGVVIVAALTNAGLIYDGKLVAAKIESYRCVLSLLLSLALPIDLGCATQLYLSILYVASIAIWFTPSRQALLRTRVVSKEEGLSKQK